MTEYLTVAEVASLARCDEKTIRRAINAGSLPAFRPTHRLLIRQSDAREWVERRGAVGRPSARPARRTRSSRSGSALADLREIERNALQ